MRRRGGSGIANKDGWGEVVEIAVMSCPQGVCVDDALKKPARVRAADPRDMPDYRARRGVRTEPHGLRRRCPCSPLRADDLSDRGNPEKGGDCTPLSSSVPPKTTAPLRSVPLTSMSTRRPPHFEHTSRVCQSRTRVSAPYRSASCAGSGSTWCWQPRHQAIRHSPAFAALPSVIGGPGPDFIPDRSRQFSFLLPFSLLGSKPA
jgi:hypothetical protein